jgi:deoxycytidylate deaminase
VREINENDVEMFLVMNRLKILSKCIDKQVVCVIVDKENNILSVGVNTIEECDQNCDDKERRLCKVRHAEIVALENLSDLGRMKADRAYVSLFPCAPCQKAMDPVVNEIITFGMVHKTLVSAKLTVFPHLSYAIMSDDDSAMSLSVYTDLIDDVVERRNQIMSPHLYLQMKTKRYNIYRRLCRFFGVSTASKAI